MALERRRAAWDEPQEQLRYRQGSGRCYHQDWRLPCRLEHAGKRRPDHYGDEIRPAPHAQGARRGIHPDSSCLWLIHRAFNLLHQPSGRVPARQAWVPSLLQAPLLAATFFLLQPPNASRIDCPQNIADRLRAQASLPSPCQRLLRGYSEPSFYPLFYPSRGFPQFHENH